ncbi:hypothetical protein LCGC14_3003860, partial [marine sediment metagenome]
MKILLDILERSHHSAATKSSYRGCVGRWLVFAGDDASGWTPIRVEQWRDALAESVAPRTVNKHLYALRYV